MEKKHVLRVLCLAVVAASLLPELHAIGQADAPAGTRTVADAEKLVTSGRFDEALQLLGTLSTQKPEPAGVERLRGMALYEQGKIAESANAFELAVAQDPADRQAMQMQGVALFRLGKPAEAIPMLEKGHLSVPSANVDPNYVLGLCYMDTRRFDDARQAFAGQYGFPPDSAAAYLLTARMLLRREYLPIAQSFAEKALSLNPNLPMAHLLLGQVKLAQSQMPEAISQFEKERDLNPLFGEVYDRLGDAYVRQGDYDKAQLALDRAVLLEPNSTAPFILLGKVLLKQQNPVMAEMYLEKALAMDPRNYITHTLLGQTYRSLGQADKASHEFQVAEQIQAAAQPKLELSK